MNKETQKELIFPTSVNGGQFVVGDKIGTGAFGTIFKGIDKDNGDQVAIKFEPIDSLAPQILVESKIYSTLYGVGISPSVRWVGNEQKFTILVMDLLGPSLADLIEKCGGKFTLKTTLALADQMLTCIEKLHKYGYIHRDIKPDNFVMGCNSESDRVFLIDFGLSRKYIDSLSGAHVGYGDGKPLIGTARYSSINNMRGIDQTRRDDLESLLYVWIFMATGDLPWTQMGGGDRKEMYKRILEQKESTAIDEVLKNLPREFTRMLYSVKQLRFSEEPNYKVLHNLLKVAFAKISPKEKITEYSAFDWKSMFPVFANEMINDDIDDKPIEEKDVTAEKKVANEKAPKEKRRGTLTPMEIKQRLLPAPPKPEPKPIKLTKSINQSSDNFFRRKSFPSKK